jgi:hypothetical protein
VKAAARKEVPQEMAKNSAEGAGNCPPRRRPFRGSGATAPSSKTRRPAGGLRGTKRPARSWRSRTNPTRRYPGSIRAPRTRRAEVSKNRPRLSLILPRTWYCEEFLRGLPSAGRRPVPRPRLPDSAQKRQYCSPFSQTYALIFLNPRASTASLKSHESRYIGLQRAKVRFWKPSQER